jgi:hypothetical protein
MTDIRKAFSRIHNLTFEDEPTGFNQVCTRIAATMVMGIVAIAIIGEIL